MPTENLVHEHVFLGAGHRRNERRVWLVIALTATMMAAEIIAGNLYGSMALVADGLHMSTHAGAMLITALAYLYARRQARNPRFTFGTGKLGDLAGFASAIVLALIALLIGWESLLRLANPVQISFSQAIAVAVIGLAVNLVSAFLLKDDHDHLGHSHGGHSHGGHAHHSHHHEAQPAGGHHDHGHSGHSYEGHAHHGHAAPGTDNNLRSAYLHVMADALTSVLAILALLAGSIYGWLWLDPAMGIVGALVIAHWSYGLIRQTGLILVDATDTVTELQTEIRERIETPQEKITDLHVWQVGPGHNAAIVAIATANPHPPAFYKEKLAKLAGLSHLTVEVTPVAA
ncbi:CDF family Co(II)/Ni(II) efflux transporter DmeF [Rhizobium sp. LjRoot98]|uniref:CDF family Co(II)/Ni(II) efflux transporter DmeF n=1 Tax=unclassified Rhizobium TaxID=2613769 RepID=UPI000713B850|nr:MULTISPECIES: CDF family Co(II)/Ni(II) efflux transporter DmeF [unclassified Rhizobium]KQV37362.1 cation transporter [Rhizobium sp. Root1204]KQY17374.1 cation transporter [Rhizobium sp. Root1334]KRC13258.1 cation transporter [Rhizobium sp. Root73]